MQRVSRGVSKQRGQGATVPLAGRHAHALQTHAFAGVTVVWMSAAGVTLTLNAEERSEP